MGGGGGGGGRMTELGRQKEERKKAERNRIINIVRCINKIETSKFIPRVRERERERARRSEVDSLAK